MKTEIRRIGPLTYSPIISIRVAISVALVIGLLGGGSGIAAENKGSALKVTLSKAPAAEMPVLAAEMVKNAKARDRAATTVEVVKAALAINPATATTLVAAIAKASPEMAAVAAGTAAEMQPKQAVEVARAAVSAAPSRAGKIVAAVCRAVPTQYKGIALAVAQVVPTAGREILQGVASGVPSLKPGIETALVNSRSNRPSVPAVLESVKAIPGGNTPPTVVAAGPGGGQSGSSPSGNPPTVTPPRADPPNPGPGPRGNRNYAAP